MTVLVLAPHPDDESIGLGGTLAKHADRGDRVVVAFLTSGEVGLKNLPPHQAHEVREAEASRACEVLGVAHLHFLRQPDWFLGDHRAEAATQISLLIKEERPELIYLPHAGEWHPDHQACLPIVREALQGKAVAGTTSPPRLLAYEVWTPLSEYAHVEDVSATMARKLRAIRCHVSQLTGFRYDHAMRGLNRYRGVIAARTKYAEVFAEVSSKAE